MKQPSRQVIDSTWARRFALQPHPSPKPRLCNSFRLLNDQLNRRHLPGATDRGQEGKSQPVRSLGMVPGYPWLRSPSNQTVKGKIPFASPVALTGLEGSCQIVEPCPWCARSCHAMHGFDLNPAFREHQAPTETNQ